MPGSIAVIVPTLNEAAALGGLLANLLEREGDFRVVIADGGSSDGTVEIARRFSGVACVRLERGRGLQMNAGARGATEDILLFLHADTFLPAGASNSSRMRWPIRRS